MDKENKKLIHGIPREKWLKAFGEATRIAIDKDYFSDILYFDLYPNETSEYYNDEDYDKLWENVKDAFKEIFNENLY